MEKTRIGFIGAGTVGTALAVHLSQRGYPVVAVASLEFAERLAGMVPDCKVYPEPQGVADTAQLVFVTTPDDAIAPVVAGLRWHPGQSVVFCSGAASSDILEPARRAGAHVGGFHPLQTFASVEAEEPLLSVLQGMAQALGGSWIKLGANDKVLYHAGAVMACNYYITLIKLATDLWQEFGVAPNQAVKALMPLIRGTLSSLENVGLPHCLTGPIARGDVGTVRKHMKAIRERAPGLLPLYRELARHTVPIALAKGGIGPEQAEEVYRFLGGAHLGGPKRVSRK